MREGTGCVRQLLEGDVECEFNNAGQPFTSSLVFALILIQDNGRTFIPQGIGQFSACRNPWHASNIAKLPDVVLDCLLFVSGIHSVKENLFSQRIKITLFTPLQPSIRFQLF